MRITSFLLLVALVWPIALQAGPAPAAASGSPAGDIRFRPFDSDRPFQAEIITEIMFDRVGFLWIGTREGLFLYDGQRFRKFQHEVQNPASISSNGIRGIFEDSRGRLWVNTISGGLNLLDRSTWRFRSWRHARNDPASIVHDGVFALAEAPGGKLWVGTQAGLDLFDPDTGRFTRQVLATGGEFVIALLNDREGRLWAATLGQGLFRQRVDKTGFELVRDTTKTTPPDIFSLAQTADGTVWIGTRDGLFRFDAQADRIAPSALAPRPVLDKLKSVTALVPAADGGLWIGTFGNGLYRLGPQADALVPVPLGTEGSGAQSIDSGALALDRDGVLFVGTFGAGLLRASPRIAGLQTWGERVDDHPGLVNPDVYALQVVPAQEPGKDALLAGSFGGGIDELVPAQGAIAHRELPTSDALRQRLNGITDLMRTRAGEIWAATNEGVYRWHPGSGTFHYYPPDATDSTSTHPGYSFALLQDREGRIWVGSAGGGLYLYQPDKDAFRNFRPQSGVPNSLPDDFVTDMLEDRRGRLWVATRSGGIGICRFDAALECRHVSAGNGPRQISHDQVTSLLDAPDDAIWAGTAGGGLNRLNLDAAGNVASVQRWMRDEGLDDENVMAMVYAPDGALWFSTHGGLSRLDPRSGRVANLTPADGLPTAVFNPKAAVLHDDRLYFGSAKGVVAIDPRMAWHSGSPPPTVIESILGLDAAQLPNQPAWQLTTLTVPWRTPFSLEFAVLDFSSGLPRFQYRLGKTDAWTDLGDVGQLTLHALAPGTYQLEVRGRRSGHGWTLARALNLEIVPPWWRRAATQAAAASLLLLVLFGGFYWRVRELQARNRELQRLHGLRERALAEAHTSQERLQEAFEMLRRTTMRLEAAKENERKHLARELHDEFGQALTTAKINLGLALGRVASEDGKARVADTIGLIDGLIGQVRALSLDLRPPLLDEMGLVPALEGYLHAISARSGLAIRSRLDADLALAAVDREIAVFRIVQEAVTNALRHAGASALEVILVAERGGVAIRVRDDGNGFDAAAMLAEGGPGLGLFGMRERVHDLGGDWSVESSPETGTLVKAFVPAFAAVDA
ncbi:MAG: histidine kinase [Proteobacteria bacterium]|nr:histidine kinase [Pseudomonadota bacterium]